MEAKHDVIILGAGAAGLFCAVFAGKRRRSVLVLERAEKPGQKILISGGGRCNFTNLHATPDNYLCSNPHFHKSALARFMPQDFIGLVEKHRIRYHEKKLGQLFCTGGAAQILQMLLKECAGSRIQIQVNCPVQAVEKRKDSFFVVTSRGKFECESLVVATGGLSIPKLGATDLGYRLAQQFGIRVVPTKPGLVPMTLSARDRAILSPLSGISVDALVSLHGRQFRENILITHRGLSGPAILQISSYWNPGDAVEINLMPDHDAREVLAEEQGSRRELKTLLSKMWTQRFAQAWTSIHSGSKRLFQYSAKELFDIAEQLQRWHILPAGTEGFSKAEVTVGGIDTAALSSQTMEVRQLPGLYFIGEVVDVTGHLGGFNFQWAWSSAHAAGQSV